MSTILGKSDIENPITSIPFSISIKPKTHLAPLIRPTVFKRRIKKTFKSASVIPNSVLHISVVTTPTNIKSEASSKRKQVILLKQKNLFSNAPIQNNFRKKFTFPDINILSKYTFKDYVADKCFNRLKKCEMNKENKAITGIKERRLNLLLDIRKLNPSVNKVSETINYFKLNRTLQLSQIGPYGDSLSGIQTKLIHYS